MWAGANRTTICNENEYLYAIRIYFDIQYGIWNDLMNIGREKKHHRIWALFSCAQYTQTYTAYIYMRYASRCYTLLYAPSMTVLLCFLRISVVRCDYITLSAWLAYNNCVLSFVRLLLSKYRTWRSFNVFIGANVVFPSKCEPCCALQFNTNVM